LDAGTSRVMNLTMEATADFTDFTDSEVELIRFPPNPRNL
jgi:hypothetical protein